MGKKKRQGEPDNDSSEGSDEYKRKECPHIKKSIDMSALKKVAYADFPFECKECSKISPLVKAEGDFEYDKSIWMCLRCGNRACGRYQNQHALAHYNTPHSDLHNICVNTSNWQIYCYECDNELDIESRKSLNDCIAFIKKQVENHSKSTSSEKKLKLSSSGSEDETPILSINNIMTSAASDLLPGVRGLANLGNTCFFNSVMQCLGQTPYLLELLEESAKDNDKGSLPGGKICLDEKEKKFVNLDPIEIEASSTGYGPLTISFVKILKELQSGKYNVIDPNSLFGQLKLKRPQFRGHDQQDSHELLRHLLEAVREECLARYNCSIKDNCNPDISSKNKNMPKKDLEKESILQKMVNFYESQASEILLPTEWVFRGVLVSTLQCQECEHTSKREEFFLDLSLPISEKQTPLILRRKVDEVEEQKPSKHQLKKEKRQAAKKNKKNRSQNLTHNLETVSKNLAKAAADEETKEDCMDNDQSDADVEDNEDSSNNVPTPEEGPSKGTESGYNSDKNKSPDNGSPDMCVDDSGVPSPIVGMHSASPVPGSPENSSESSEINNYLGSPLCGRSSPILDSNDEYERPESRLSFVNNKSSDLKAGLEKLSLKNEKANDMEGACGGFVNNYMEEKMDIDHDIWGETITARYNTEEGECSVQSCLSQFTSPELLTSNNKVSCDECTKRHGGSEKKIVYTNAQKQLLICNPPAVLILHLKRFQVSSFRLAKMGKHVKFPTILDIAPFCSKRSKNISTFKESETKVLYSLYGVVEHSGSMHGGHYVAYVKVRPKLSRDNYRWGFLPQNKNGSKNQESEPTDLIPSGKWYYISDSYTSEVSESKVLSRQAYLLFYERVL